MISRLISRFQNGPNEDMVTTVWQEYKDLVSQIDAFIDSRQYRSVESLQLQLDEKVLSLSKLLLSAGISGETILFYGLPLNITGDVRKGKDWTNKTNHWFIGSDSSLWVAWRQDAAYFCYVKEHVRDSDYDNFTRTVSRGDEIFEKYFNIQFSSENHVSLHADNLKNRSATTESIELALKKSSKKWGRGKIMLVGEGRAG